MQNTVVRINVANQFDRAILKTKLKKVESLGREFVPISKIGQGDNQFSIEYQCDSLVPLRTVSKDIQSLLFKSSLSRLPYLLKENNISTRISVSSIVVSPCNQFKYLLSPGQFEIASVQEGILLQKMYTIQWESISRVTNIQSPLTSPLTSPNQSSINSISNITRKQEETTRTQKQSLLTESRKMATETNCKYFSGVKKPVPKSKEDFTVLKSLQFQNLLTNNQQYVHEFLDILSDDRPQQLKVQDQTLTSSGNTITLVRPILL